MIAILYPKGDEIGSYLAYRTRAAALGQELEVYVPPRAGRRAILPKEIRYILKKARSGFLIVGDPEIGLDNFTWAELNFLLESGKKVKSLAPADWIGLEDLQGLLPVRDILVYDIENPSEILRVLKKEIEREEKMKPGEKALLAVALMGIAFLFMWGLAETSKRR